MKQTPLEKTFQTKVLKKLKTLPHSWHLKLADRAKSGLPDIFICVRGRFIAMELKRSSAHDATPLQKFTLEKIRDAGGSAMVVSPENWDETWNFLCGIAVASHG